MTRRAIAAGIVVGAVSLAADSSPSVEDAQAAQARRTPPAPLTQAELNRLRASIGIPALAAAAQTQSETPLEWVSGVRRRGAPEPATTLDRWHVGSIAKSMTATLAALCVEAGELSWADTVEHVLGPLAPDMRDEYRDVTLIHLLSHRAGMQTDVIDFAALGLEFGDQDSRDARRAIARQALRQAPAGPPETTYDYSHAGYLVATAMLEAKLGMPWEALIRERLFTPLGLRETGFGPPGLDGEGPQPVGHASWFTPSITPHPPGESIADIPAAWRPAGGVHATMGDLLLYLNAHRDRTALLKRETWRLLHTPPFGGDYALGWYIRDGKLWHNGANTMWYAEILADPAAKKSAVAVCNDGRMDTVTPVVHATLISAAQH